MRRTFGIALGGDRFEARACIIERASEIRDLSVKAEHFRGGCIVHFTRPGTLRGLAAAFGFVTREEIDRCFATTRPEYGFRCGPKRDDVSDAREPRRFVCGASARRFVAGRARIVEFPQNVAIQMKSTGPVETIRIAVRIQCDLLSPPE